MCLPLTTEQIVLQFIPSEMPEMLRDAARSIVEWRTSNGERQIEDGGSYMLATGCGLCAWLWFHSVG